MIQRNYYCHNKNKCYEVMFFGFKIVNFYDPRSNDLMLCLILSDEQKMMMDEQQNYYNILS